MSSSDCDTVSECLARLQVEMPEVTQSEIGQKQKLSAVLGVVNNILQLPPSWNQHKWSVDSQSHFVSVPHGYSYSHTTSPSHVMQCFTCDMTSEVGHLTVFLNHIIKKLPPQL